MKRSNIALAITLSLSAFMITACNDSDKGYNSIKPEQTFIAEADYSKDSLIDASSIKIMTYNMAGVQGKTVKATAMVMFPKVAPAKDGYRIVVWEHGTVGVADACAPSNNKINTNFKVLADSLLASGYVIVAPDYEGLGTAGIHPYLNLASEAQSALAAVKAVKERYAHLIQGSWMSVGQSQGGHASLGTAEYANTDSTYKGAVAAAPASSLAAIILDVAPKALTDIENKEIQNNVPLEHRISVDSYATLLAYAALTGVGIKAYEPSFNYRDIFQTRSQPLAELAEGTTGENGLCLDHPNDSSLSLIEQFKMDMLKFLKDDPSKRVMDYPGLNVDHFKRNQSVQTFLAASQPGTKRLDKPVLIVQGTADTNVPAPITQALVENLIKLGSAEVRFLAVENATHTEAIVKKNADIVAFIQEKMSAR